MGVILLLSYHFQFGTDIDWEAYRTYPLTLLYGIRPWRCSASYHLSQIDHGQACLTVRCRFRYLNPEPEVRTGSQPEANGQVGGQIPKAESKRRWGQGARNRKSSAEPGSGATDHTRLQSQGS